MMFLFAILGNIFYAGQILSYSLKYDYLIKSLPWLIGSMGTMLCDVLILSQFIYYRGRPNPLLKDAVNKEEIENIFAE